MSKTTEQSAEILKQYHQRVEEKLRESIPALGPKTPLRDACEYGLLNGGKRLRPIIVMMVADALKKGGDASDAAMAIEFFHTASLVADDLPCMDDDDERRNRPSLHKAHGETVALLVSYALIAAGYEKLATNAKLIKEANLSFSSQSDRICVLALENATYNTGLDGATGGQFLDVFPPDLSLSTLREVLHKKTVSLFEVSFVMGWLYGGGDLSQLETIKKAASHFGMAFQIADDIGDLAQDEANGRKVNMAAVFGLEKAKQMCLEEKQGFHQALRLLKLDGSPLSSLL